MFKAKKVKGSKSLLATVNRGGGTKFYAKNKNTKASKGKMPVGK
jgi:hypothetical protein